MNSPIQPWPGICLVLAILLGLMVSLSACRRRGALLPETARKILHIGMGLVALSFPWLFACAWPVLLLTGIAILVLAAVRLFVPLRTYLGSALHDVKRGSLGEFYFAAAVVLLFLLSGGQKLLFCLPMLLLTLADPAATLVGGRYGKWRFTRNGDKTVQGSLAFFGVAFGSLYPSLLLSTGQGATSVLFLALTLSLLVTLIEAVATHGLDNLCVPLGTFALLRSLSL